MRWMVSFRYYDDQCGNKCFDDHNEADRWVNDNKNRWRSYSIHEIEEGLHGMHGMHEVYHEFVDPILASQFS